MYNTKLTRKDITNCFSKIYCVGYCDLYDFLKHNERIGYNCGVYGWNFDAYNINGVCITTGYRNTIGKRLPKEFYDLYKKYEIKRDQANYLDRSKVFKRYYNKFLKLLETLDYNY